MIQFENDEQEIARIKKHYMYFFAPLFFTIMWAIYVNGKGHDSVETIIGTLISPPFFWLVYKIARYAVDEIVLTNQKFYIRVGLIKKDVISTPLKKINNVSYSQGLLGRICGYGTIYVQSAAILGGSGYSYIINPDKVKNTIEQAIEAKESN